MNETNITFPKIEHAEKILLQNFITSLKRSKSFELTEKLTELILVIIVEFARNHESW